MEKKSNVITKEIIHNNRVGIPSRDENLDVYFGFKNPPQGYGEVAFYWWLGDKLDKDRILYQLDKLKDNKVMALQINYAHSDVGGQAWGLTYENEPHLFSEQWWELFNLFLKEAKERNMSVSLSDYTLGIPGQGWYTDEILKDNPEICGATIENSFEYVEEGNKVIKEILENTLSVVAYKVINNKLVEDSKVNLLKLANKNKITWNVPEGKWKVITVYYNKKKLSIDPMNEDSGKEMIAKFFNKFEARNLNECGKGLNFFFSDELTFGVSGKLWNDKFLNEFKKRKGYDLLAHIELLFEDINDFTPKVRLDYSDVIIELQEENYFKPVYDWHEERGMIYGCDHGGRGREVTEFGDYFRTQKWNQAPGNDQPGLASDIIKNKVSSSITHLYERPRTWLEGYYGSGWGTSTEDLSDATFRNFIMGHNLLTLHGLYYSTHGGWWEWAPPCNHFRMPYWNHIKEFMNCEERLSYLLSQGVHACDIALIYPVAAMECGINGEQSVNTSFAIAENLYKDGIDFDFMDFQSLERATISDKKINVAKESYKVLIIPEMKAVRYSTMVKALEFYRNGGIVIAAKAVPIASDRIGYNDEKLKEVIKEIFGEFSEIINSTSKVIRNENSNGGIGIVLQRKEEINDFITNAFKRDFINLSKNSESPWVMHRKIGKREIYMVYKCKKNNKCFFRAKGKAELWNPWNGEVIRLRNVEEVEEGTIITMPLSEKEAQIIVFSHEYTEESGKYEFNYDTDKKEIYLNDLWNFELKPTLDNLWGDYRLPAFNDFIGAEGRKILYKHGNEKENYKRINLNKEKWKEVTYSYGTYFWKIGPLPNYINTDELDKKLCNLKYINKSNPINIEGNDYYWTAYDFSMRFGIENDPGHEGYHGLKGLVSNDFIALGKKEETATSTIYNEEIEGGIYYLWTSIVGEKNDIVKIKAGDVYPDLIVVNGEKINCNSDENKENHDYINVNITKGNNFVLLRYNKATRTHFIVEDEKRKEDSIKEYPLSMEWYKNPSVLQFDVYPEESESVEWFKFTAPPALKSMEMIVQGKIEAWIKDIPLVVESKGINDDGSYGYKLNVQEEVLMPEEVVIRVKNNKGYYGGAVICEPIKLNCGKGIIRIGDWSKIQGLNSYSGGALYSQNININKEQIGEKMILDLGNVISSAEVFINGESVGIKVASPWTFDIKEKIKNGDNLIEVLVYNTLSNHYTTIPTRYRGELTSGLLGIVKIISYK